MPDEGPVVTTPRSTRESYGAVIYVGAVFVVGMAFIMAALPGFPQGHWFDLILFATLASLAELWNVDTSVESSMSLSFTVNFAAALLFGPAFGAITAASGSLVTDGLIRRRAPIKVMFNVGQFAVCASLAGLTYDALRVGPQINLTKDALAIIAAAAVGLVVNDTLISGVLSLHGRSFVHEWTISFREVGILYVSMAPLGALLAFAYQESPWNLLYFPFLVFVIYNGFKLYVNLQVETDNALVALADTVDKRDQYTYQHSQRVAKLAGEVAARLNLPAKEIDLIISAARVHDLGKISTDNRILYKQASLTEEERRLINDHPVAGSELAAKFSMYRKGCEYIRHHHERWDGKGYPDGLAAEAIPKGARIIAVADSYDAMTSDRPYRQALPHEVAIAELMRGKAKQYDPRVVDAFCLDAPAETPAAVPVTTAPEPC
jgi:putative nucleotidyltransferase with HDIG domain